jgi:hypothetical protein
MALDRGCKAVGCYFRREWRRIFGEGPKAIPNRPGESCREMLDQRGLGRHPPARFHTRVGFFSWRRAVRGSSNIALNASKCTKDCAVPWYIFARISKVLRSWSVRATLALKSNSAACRRSSSTRSDEVGLAVCQTMGRSFNFPSRRNRVF